MKKLIYFDNSFLMRKYFPSDIGGCMIGGKCARKLFYILVIHYKKQWRKNKWIFMCSYDAISAFIFTIDLTNLQVKITGGGAVY